jgi:small subunit ribosomal protein S8
MTDPIADLLTRIRNAYGAKHDTVSIPHSNQKEAIAKVLANHGYVNSVEVVAENALKSIVVTLKYIGNSPALTKIDRISSPGRRVYSASKDIKQVLAGNGIRIISTNKGIMTDAEAKSQKLGGEVICKVW